MRRPFLDLDTSITLFHQHVCVISLIGENIVEERGNSGIFQGEGAHILITLVMERRRDHVRHLIRRLQGEEEVKFGRPRFGHSPKSCGVVQWNVIWKVTDKLLTRGRGRRGLGIRQQVGIRAGIGVAITVSQRGTGMD